MTFKPMLLSPIQAHDLTRLCKDDMWVLQQKIDGRRVMLKPQASHTIVYSRSGSLMAYLNEVLPPKYQTAILDAEYLPSLDFYFVFDVIFPATPAPLHQRLGELEQLLAHCEEGRLSIGTLSTYFGTEAKFSAALGMLRNHAEGVVLKKLNAFYEPGVRSTNACKFKFVNQVRCMITDASRDNKRNFILSCYDPGIGKWVEVGKVSALTGDGPSLSVGDYCRVTYLTFTRDGHLREPVTPMREDAPEDAREMCSITQLR